MEWKCSLPLRDYQVECLNAVDEAFRHTNKVLISIATGGGKTIIFNTYAFNKNYRTLVIAHRDELLEQAVEKLRLVEVGRKTEAGYIRRGEWKVAPYTVASIQTLYRNLDRLDGADFDLVVWDETHHIASPTYRAVYNRLFETNPDLKMLGVTATPFRTDKQSLKEFFDVLAYSIDTVELIRRGYLVPIKGKIIPLPIDIDSVKVVEDSDGVRDFSQKGLSEVLNNDEVNDLIVEKWLEHGEGRKTIFYLTSLEHAETLAQLFEERGVPSAFIHGGLSMNVRRSILRDFKEGKIKVLTNMNVLTEGFDDPEVECIGIVRPTKSLVLYAQIVGRGLRIAPKKKDCLILDYTGISEKHSVVGLPDLFGIEDEEVKKQIEAGETFSIGAREGSIKVLIGDKPVEFDFEGKEASKYATVIGSAVVLNGGKNNKVLVMEKKGDGYIIYLYHDGRKTVLKDFVTSDYAWAVLTGYWKNIRDSFVEEFSDRAVKEPPTKRQEYIINNAVRLGLLKEEELPKEMTKMDASNIISFLFANKQFSAATGAVLRRKEDFYIDEELGIGFTREEVLAIIGCECTVTIYRDSIEDAAVYSYNRLSRKLREKAKKYSEDVEVLKRILRKGRLPYKVYKKVSDKLNSLINGS